MEGVCEMVRGALLLPLVPFLTPFHHASTCASLCVLASIVAEGGTISDLRAADYLFSCDASHPDTLRYLAVFLGRDEPGVGTEVSLH